MAFGSLSVAGAGMRAKPRLPPRVPDRASGRGRLRGHAAARAPPGVGDPANFRLGDCATQRNLSEEGRAQAGHLGERLRAHGIQQAEVYSSQWCRCLETAGLLELGPVAELLLPSTPSFPAPATGPARKPCGPSWRGYPKTAHR